MKILITNNCPEEIIEAYKTNPIFHNIVSKHETLGHDYTKMLEDALLCMIREANLKHDLIMKYAERFGTIN